MLTCGLQLLRKIPLLIKLLVQSALWQSAVTVSPLAVIRYSVYWSTLTSTQDLGYHTITITFCVFISLVFMTDAERILRYPSGVRVLKLIETLAKDAKENMLASVAQLVSEVEVSRPTIKGLRI